MVHYEDLKDYLKTNLPRPSLDFTWTDEDNVKLFDHIRENFSKDCLKKKENLLMIRQAFKEYFEPVGYILFKINSSRLRLKVFPYKIHPKDSLNLEAVKKILFENKDMIVYDYKGRDDHIVVPPELKKKLDTFLAAIDNEEINKKDLLKYSVRQAFELNESDIIIVKQEQVFIKLIDEKKYRKVSESEKNTIAGRYNGIDEASLKSFHDDYFSSAENKNFFIIVAKLFVEKYFNELKIDNNTYEKNVFGFIQSIIIEQLVESFDYSEEFFKGFSGYIFRIHFKEVFEHIADLIITEIAIGNKYMIEFLKYYSLDVLIVNGKKYKVPLLETETGMRWNVISMLSIVKIYVKVRQTLKVLKREFKEIKDETMALYIGDLSPVEYQTRYVKERERIDRYINEKIGDMDKCSDALFLSKDENEKKSLKAEIKAIKDDIQHQRAEKSKLKGVKQNTLKTYTDLRAEMDSMQRELNRETKILEQTEDSYQSIKGALVRALIAKKQIL